MLYQKRKEQSSGNQGILFMRNNGEITGNKGSIDGIRNGRGKEKESVVIEEILQENKQREDLTQANLMVSDNMKQSKTESKKGIENSIGPSNQAQERCKATEPDFSMVGGQPSEEFRVEFPIEIEEEEALQALVPYNGLSPLSAVTMGLKGIRIKRPITEPSSPNNPKRRRQLSFEEPGESGEKKNTHEAEWEPSVEWEEECPFNQAANLKQGAKKDVTVNILFSSHNIIPY